MSEVLTLPTENPDVLLRILSSLADDKAYLQGVLENPEHLMRFGDTTGEKYQRIEQVTYAREHAGSKLRFGIWEHETNFKGSINATPNKGWDSVTNVEIGYWLRASAVGNGYATLAVVSLTQYLQSLSRQPRIFADVHEDNIGSMHVLERASYRPTGTFMRNWGRAIVFEPSNQAQSS